MWLAMPPSAIPLRFVAGLLAACAFAASAAAAEKGDDAEPPVKAELVAEYTALVAGQPQSLGLLLHHRPHWHTYWINPGDSGLPTTLAWTLPAGYQAEAIGWPVPQRFDVGGLYNFGYEGDLLLPVVVNVPDGAAAGSTAHIAVAAKWLACREACIAGSASLSIDLPVVRETATADARWTAAFSAARLAQPQVTAWKGDIAAQGDRFAVRLSGPGLPSDATELDAFAVQRKLFDNAPPKIRRDGDALLVETGKSDYFTAPPSELELVLSQPGAAGVHGWRVRIPFPAASANAMPSR